MADAYAAGRSEFDPPEPPVLGSDAPKVAELVGFVVAAVGGKPDVVHSDRYGECEVTRLDRLVVFDEDGVGTEYPDFLIFQTALRPQTLRPLTIGRLARPQAAFVLQPVKPTLRDKVVAELEANGWMPGKSKPEPSEQERPVRTRRQVDDDDAF